MASQTNFAFSKSSPAAAADEVLVQWLQSAGDPNLISGPVKSTGGVDARTGTSEAITLAARGKLLTFNNGSAVAASLPNANTLNGVWWACVRNLGSGAVTLTPSGCTIDGASSLVLASGAGLLIFGDLTNYFTMSGASSGGTVTSVALTAPGIFTVTGSPITGSGTLALGLATQSANLVWAGPTSGSPSAPTFRALVSSDIPNIAESQVTNLTTDLAAKVPTSRNINTTAPITGGGDLSADRTIAISNFTGDSGSGGAKGAVPAPASGDAAAGKFLKADGTWSAPSGSSPLTTKGDLYTRSASVDARFGIGSDGQVLIADSSQSSGLRWGAAGSSGGGYSNTPPIESNFSWINQGVYAFSGGTSTPTLLYTAAGATGVNLHCRVMTAPATPYTKKIRASAKVSAGGGIIWRFGIVLRESSSGKLVTIDLDVNAGQVPHVIKWNSPTSFSAFYTVNTLLGGINAIDPRYINFKIEDDGTNRKFYVDLFKQQGEDTENWQLVHSVARTDFCTPDQVGYFIDNEGTGAMIASIYDWI